MKNVIISSRKTSTSIMLLLITLGLLFSCSSKQEEVMKKVNYTWELINQSRNSEILYTEIPLGFKLNSTGKEYQVVINQLVNGNDQEESSLTSVTTDYFGWKQKIWISNFHYFSDPNTETDTISSITFIFDSLKYESDSKIRIFSDSINKLFDKTWQVVEYQLDTESEKLSHFYRYWIKGNIVVEFKVDYGSITLTYYNAPKSYDCQKDNFYKNIDSYYRISEQGKQKRKENENKGKIENSPWDGSVYQVKKYLNKTLKDPKSYESIEWSTVSEKDGYYFVNHKYRAKNSFGGYVIETIAYKLDENGTVISADKIE